MGFDVGSLTGIAGDLFKMAPSTNDLANQVVTGAVASVLLSGLKTNAGMDAVDPLHIIPRHDASGTPGSMIVGKTIPASAFNALAPDAKNSVMTAGYTIVAG